MAHRTSHHNFHAFCNYPQVQIESQRPGEVVVLTIRQHPFTQIPWVLNSIGLVFLLVASNFFLPNFFDTNHIFYANIAGVTMIFTYAWANFLHWVYNVGIVTSQRIFDIDFHNTLYKEVTATTLDHVSDVTSKIGGFFGSLFQYGNVLVKTEGFEQNIEFERSPRPTAIVHIINDLIKPHPDGID